jgi:hypothetical protein
MKTNRSARQIRKRRAVLLFVGLLMVIGLEFVLGGVLASRFGQVTALQTDQAEAPNAGLGDLLLGVP